MFLPLLAGKMVGDWIGGANAASAQEKNAADAMSVQKEVYNQQQRNFDAAQANFNPYLEAGRTSLADLMRQMQSGGFDTQYTQFDPSQLANDPGFQFRMAQGQRALERSAAARGGLNSGGLMKGLARYSQGVASDEFGNAWNRHQAEYATRQGENLNRFNRLSNIVGLGGNAAGNIANINNARSGMMSGFANSLSSLYGAKGNAQAAGAQALPQAYGNYVNTMGNMAMAGVGAVSGLGGLGNIGGMGGAVPRQQAAMPMGDYGYNPNRGYG